VQDKVQDKVEDKVEDEVEVVSRLASGFWLLASVFFQHVSFSAFQRFRFRFPDFSISDF
jgi:hypothetical protein